LTHPSDFCLQGEPWDGERGTAERRVSELMKRRHPAVQAEIDRVYQEHTITMIHPERLS
jgi:hypothetical protein